MASYFNVTLDTLAPQGVTFSINNNDTYSNSAAVTAYFSTEDVSTTNYQIKIWGAVNPASNADIQTLEGDSDWIAYSAEQAVVLSSEDGSKTVYAKVRDDVWNETSQLSDSITLDTAAPVVTISAGPDVNRISKVSGKRQVTFTWESDTAFIEYKVKVVSATNSIHSNGTTIVDTSTDSDNLSGSSSYPATTGIVSVIDGRDLDDASPGDGEKVIKVFVLDTASNWSVA